MKQIVKKPLISEKSYRLATDHKYTFSVDTNATKDEIKAMVEKLFNVTVLKVNSLRVAGKSKRTKKVLGKRDDVKKVIVTLDKKQSISLFEIEKEEDKTNKKSKKADKTENTDKKAKIAEAKSDVEVTIKAKGQKRKV